MSNFPCPVFLLKRRVDCTKMQSISALTSKVHENENENTFDKSWLSHSRFTHQYKSLSVSAFKRTDLSLGVCARPIITSSHVWQTWTNVLHKSCFTHTWFCSKTTRLSWWKMTLLFQVHLLIQTLFVCVSSCL